jgi:hypothetical protein
VKLGLKEKRQEKGKEEGCMERNVHKNNSGNSKEMETTIRDVEDAMKENREDRILLGGEFNGRIGERGASNWEVDKGDGKKNPNTRWEIQRGRD